VGVLIDGQWLDGQLSIGGVFLSVDFVDIPRWSVASGRQGSIWKFCGENYYPVNQTRSIYK
jgi:hypothetical protein